MVGGVVFVGVLLVRRYMRLLLISCSNFSLTLYLCKCVVVWWWKFFMLDGKFLIILVHVVSVLFLFNFKKKHKWNLFRKNLKKVISIIFDKVVYMFVFFCLFSFFIFYLFIPTLKININDIQWKSTRVLHFCMY